MSGGGAGAVTEEAPDMMCGTPECLDYCPWPESCLPTDMEVVVRFTVKYKCRPNQWMCLAGLRVHVNLSNRAHLHPMC